MMKFIHAGLHTVAFVLAVISLVAVFDFHNYKSIPNMYSLHSWIGLMGVVFYTLQVGTLEKQTGPTWLEFLFNFISMYPIWNSKYTEKSRSKSPTKMTVPDFFSDSVLCLETILWTRLMLKLHACEDTAF